MITIGGRAHTIDEIIQVCELNYPFVEINLDDPVTIESQLDVLLELKEKYKIDYLAHYPNEGNPGDLKTLETVFVPKVKKLIEFSPQLEIKKGTLHFWMDKRWASEKVISEKIKLLSELVDHAEKFNLQLCLENLTARHDSFARYFAAIPNLKMTLDIGHGQLLSKENTAFGFMAHVFEKIEHIHVHDNLGGTGVKDDLHLPLGEGIVDYPKILSTLVEKGYHSTITMEVKPERMAKTKKCMTPYIR
jgi:sugar phosphate isomerase/epimerase